MYLFCEYLLSVGITTASRINQVWSIHALIADMKSNLQSQDGKCFPMTPSSESSIECAPFFLSFIHSPERMEILTELPLELWIDILRLAVWVPDPLKYPLVIHPACSSNVLSTCAMRRYRKALVGSLNMHSTSLLTNSRKDYQEAYLGRLPSMVCPGIPALI